jgi:two-component system sensor histidine kinase BarA
LEAGSGYSAVDTLRKVTPSHLLLDLKMPDFDGIAVVRHVRETLQNADMVIVAYTAHAFKEDSERLLQSGFNSLLIKPVLYADFAEVFGPASCELT